MRKLGWLGCLLAALAVEATAEEAPDGIAFFERKIRPVLVEQCYGCHSAEAEGRGKLKGGLRLDSRDGLLLGGDSGPAVVPGEPDESPLVAALRYDDVTRMPPRGKLPEAVIADFAAWVAQGAPDPRADAPGPARGGIDVEAGRAHWAYRPPRRQPIPDVSDAAWPVNDIDRFVLARLEAEGLRPVAEADRATLARRLAFDLHGLPPSPEAIDAFVNDPSPTAYERFVDRLLASPHFGERWGRHWLDVARFGESLTLRGFVLASAWRYRDYVIGAFNADRPYDQFIREQVAGDLLPTEDLEGRRRGLIATAFLALGNTNLEEQDKEQLRMDVVDEQLDTIGKAFLAQTIGCARCHDHKFDPIPTRDYYALAGILRNVKAMEHANVSKWIDRPLPVAPEQEEALAAHEASVAALEARIKEAKARLPVAGRGGVLTVGAVPGVVVDDAEARKIGAWKHSQYSKTYIGAGYLHDLDEGKGEKTLTFQPDLPEAGAYEVRLAYSTGGNRAAAVPVTIMSADGEAVVRVDQRTAPPVEGRFVSLGRYRFERGDQGYVLISNEGTAGHVVADAVVFLPVDRPGAATAAGTGEGEALRALEAELTRLRDSGPVRETVVSVVEEAEIGEARVHHRGSVHTLGEEVPRGFLRVASWAEPPAMPSHESGRRELAAWLSAAENPLPARVFVNRAWHWLFGAGLVRSVDNFGTTGEPPSHPELLDHLAAQFVEDGWSVKALVRRIVLSRTYRLSTADDPRARAIDPDGRMLGRRDRRRLDAECLRDAMLSVGGELRGEMGGPSFPADLKADYGFRYEGMRRSVYAPVFRNALPEVLAAFDFADPSLVVGRRDASTVAPQALLMMNHPFVLARSRAAAFRLLGEPFPDDRGRLDRAYRLALGRPPGEAERRIALAFLAEAEGEGREAAWAGLVQALFGSIDFRFVE